MKLIEKGLLCNFYFIFILVYLIRIVFVFFLKTPRKTFTMMKIKINIIETLTRSIEKMKRGYAMAQYNRICLDNIRKPHIGIL